MPFPGAQPPPRALGARRLSAPRQPGLLVNVADHTLRARGLLPAPFHQLGGGAGPPHQPGQFPVPAGAELQLLEPAVSAALVLGAGVPHERLWTPSSPGAWPGPLPCRTAHRAGGRRVPGAVCWHRVVSPSCQLASSSGRFMWPPFCRGPFPESAVSLYFQFSDFRTWQATLSSLLRTSSRWQMERVLGKESLSEPGRWRAGHVGGSVGFLRGCSSHHEALVVLP